MLIPTLPARTRTGLLVAALAGLLAAGVLVTVDPGSTPARPATGHLPFDLPAREVLRDADERVWAHYFPPLPISLDNDDPDEDYYAEEYLDPEGEDGKHAEYGGLLRDRPLGRAPIDDDDWRLEDMRTEVRRAVAAGLDGFTLDILQFEDGSDSRLWRNTLLLLEAAQDIDPEFDIVLMPDMSGSLARKSVEEVAASLAELAERPAAHRLEDGRLLVSPFKAEAHPPQWWRELLEVMEDDHGVEVALLPTFVQDERELVDDYAEFSYGMSIWGARNPEENDPGTTAEGSMRSRAEAVTSRDLVWMQPVSVQDQRPNQGDFDEAENTRNLRNTWALARSTGAQLVQIPTWNDYSEATHVAPSPRHGWTFLDVSAYYLAWFKTGRPPTIVRDAVYLTHRTQPVDAEPTYDQDELMEVRGATPPRDTVEALTFLTRPATVQVQVGDEQHECDVDAGVDTCVVPLSTGQVSARVVREGDTVAAVESPHEVTDEPFVQDLQYVGVSSLRQDRDG